MLDACGSNVNGHYWVCAAAAPTREYTIYVTDTLTGAVRAYSNPFGRSSAATTDTLAFATCSGTASGAQVRYYNNLFCPAAIPFTSTLTTGTYSFQSVSTIPSVYQLVSMPSLAPPFVEINDSPCGGVTYTGGSLPLDAGRKYAIAQTEDAEGRLLQLLDEGPALLAGGAAVSASEEGPPAGRVVREWRPLPLSLSKPLPALRH